jgi:hypothetical protein
MPFGKIDITLAVPENPPNLELKFHNISSDCLTRWHLIALQVFLLEVRTCLTKID